MNIKFTNADKNKQTLDTPSNYNLQTPALKFDPRCTYKNKTFTIEKTTDYQFDGQKFEPQTLENHPKKTINDSFELKASRQTMDTTRNARCKQPVRKQISRNSLKMDEIGNLLSQFKNKFAHIQQKYLIPVKPKDNISTLKFQPMTPQNSQPSKFDNPSNNFFFETTRNLGPTTPHRAFNNIQIFYPSGAEQNSRSHMLKTTIDSKQKLQEKINRSQTFCPSTQNKFVDKFKSRATFGPIQSHKINVPIRRIKEAEQASIRDLRLYNCKDVESQIESQQEQEEMIQSVVIEKYSSQWKKVKKAQTLNQVQTKQCRPFPEFQQFQHQKTKLHITSQRN